MKNSKITVRKKGNNDVSTTIESPKKSQKGSKFSPTKSSKYKN